MSRFLRMEYPDAWRHVMNRGRRAEEIFSNDANCVMCTELLKETFEMWNVRIAATCWMPDHFHLPVQTLEADMSGSMRGLNGVYTQQYNRRHGCDGPVFRSRFNFLPYAIPGGTFRRMMR